MTSPSTKDGQFKVLAAGVISSFALVAIVATSNADPAFAIGGVPTAKDITVHVRSDLQTTTGHWLRGNNDPDFHYVIISEASHGYVNEFNGVSGSVTYTPEAGFHGTDSFTYLIRANGWPQTESNTATVTVVVK